MAQELADKIRAAAQAKGIDPDVALAIARAESSLNPSAKAKTSTAGGLFQVIDRTWKEYGGRPGRKNDPDENIRVGTDIIARNTQYLRNILQRDPRAAEIYAAHYFGPTGARSVISASPDTPIADVLGKDAIRANPNLKGKTTGQVLASLEGKVGGAAKQPSVSRETVPEQTPAEKIMEPALRSGMTAKVAPQDLGPSYQAALALSFLADTDETKGEKDIDNEPSVAEKWLSEQPSRPTALAGLDEIKIRSPFPETQQPVMMADGGDASTAAQMLRSFVFRAKGSPEKGETAEPTPEELEAASKPAFLTPKSGIGRKTSTKPGEIEAAALQGVSETPYNVLGAPVDLVTMAMRPFGYDVKAPVGGSDWIKEKMTQAGIRPEAPTAPTQRAFYELGQLGGSSINPAAPVRGAVAGAEKVGEAVMQAGRAGERLAERVVPQIMERGGRSAEMLQALAAPPSYMFVRARPEAAARHVELESLGFGPEQIRAQNLTQRDYRGNLIEEISDAPAVVKQKTTSSPRGFYSVMEHPELQSIYPGYDMPEVMLRTTKRKNAMRASGSFDPQANTIESMVRDLPPYNPMELTRGNLLHEGQHAIQEIEGFVGGANPSSFVAYVKARKGTYSPDPTVNANVIREMERAFPNLPQVTDNFTAKLANSDKYTKYAAGNPDAYIGEALYRHVPGEVQAELARIRGDLTPQQLRETPHEVSMQQLGIDPNNILQINKMGSRPDRYIGDINYNPSSAAMQLGMVKDPGKVSEPFFQHIPSAEAPFVGRLDEFVSGLQAPVRKDQFLGQLKGKFRDYDIARAQAVLDDLPSDAKIAPFDLLNRLKSQYDPSTFRTTIVPPEKPGSFFQSVDNPYQGSTGDGPPLGVIHLSQSADPALAQVRQIADSARRALSQFGVWFNQREWSPQIADDLLKAANNKAFSLSETTANNMRSFANQYRQLATQENLLEKARSDMLYPALSTEYKTNRQPYVEEFLKQPGITNTEAWRRAEARVVQEAIDRGNRVLQAYGVPPVPMPDFSTLSSPGMWAVAGTPQAKKITQEVNDLFDIARAPLITERKNLAAPANEILSSFRKEIGHLIPYKGQHTSLKNPDDTISFSRFSEHTADIPGIGKADGIYVNELQSDRLDDLRKLGPKGGSREKDIAEIDKLTGQHDELQRAMYTAQAAGDNDLAKQYDAQSRGIRSRISALSRHETRGEYSIPESFAGMETSPQATQQLMIKNAITGAMQMGKQFVAFPGKESAQAQLYEKLPFNLKQVVKDLGPGFELRDVTLVDPDGKQLMHRAVVWGPEAAARIQKKGVPFKDGGAVERNTADHRKYL